MIIESLKSFELINKIREEDGLRGDYLDELLDIVKKNQSKGDLNKSGREFWESHLPELKPVEAWTITLILQLLKIDIYASSLEKRIKLIQRDLTA